MQFYSHHYADLTVRKQIRQYWTALTAGVQIRDKKWLKLDFKAMIKTGTEAQKVRQVKS